MDKWQLEVSLKDFRVIPTWQIENDETLSLNLFKDMTNSVKVEIFPEISAYFTYSRLKDAKQAEKTFLSHLAAVGTGGRVPVTSIKRI
jgi:hypothetical protein